MTKKGSKNSRGQGVKCLLSINFIIVLSVLSTSDLKVWIFLRISLEPWNLGPLTP